MQVDNLLTRVNTISEELTILQQGISESYDAYARKLLGKEDLSVQNQITELQAQRKMYDRRFQEKESIFQAIGGKTRKQTLQEFTLLLFFVSYFVFAISIAVWKSVHGGAKDGAKIFGILLVTLLPIIGLLLKFL